MSNREDNLPVFGYYKLRGWAGPIRLMLAYLKVNHREILYPVPTFEAGQGEWAKDKYSLGLDFPNIPYWIDGEIKLTETKAILKHIAREKDEELLGVSNEEKSRANMLEEVVWDMWIALTNVCREYSESKKIEFVKEGLEKLKYLDSFIGNNVWAVGNNIRYVDFIMYEILDSYQKFSEKLLFPYPRLLGFKERFESLPSIKEYMCSSLFVRAPYFSYKFKAKL